MSKGKLGSGLLLLALLLPPASPATSQPVDAGVKLIPDRATLPIPPNLGKTDGLLRVMLKNIALDEVTLHASPLALGDTYATARFTASGSDVLRMDNEGLHCEPGKECLVRYEIDGAWASGLFQGTIEADTGQGKVASTPVAALRPVAAFHPTIISDALHDDRLVFDATNGSSFLLQVQNPMGSPPHTLMLSGGPADAGCPGSTGTPGSPVSFVPAQFQLEPGSTQTVVATVAACRPGDRLTFLHIADGNGQAAGIDKVIALSRYAPTYYRQCFLLLFVVVGSVVSVALNNIFPINRAKNALRNDLSRVDEVLLNDCSSAGAALIEGLRAEAMRLRLSLDSIHFYDASKVVASQEVQRGVTALAVASALTRQISLTRSKANGAVISIRTHAAVRGKLRDAEDALLANDGMGANARLSEAQTILNDAINDVGQKALLEDLRGSLSKLMTERGTLKASNAGTGTPPSDAPEVLEQPENRNFRIKMLIEQLHRDSTILDKMLPEELINVERDFYVADVWTEYVGPKLYMFADPSLSSRLPGMTKLSEALLCCLLSNPKSDHTQDLLDLLRSDVTLDDIADALGRKEARIECDAQSKYLKGIDVAFAFTNPVLNSIPAARRLLAYEWKIDDGASPPPNVDRFRHYFRQPAWQARLPWSAAATDTRNISLGLQVLFTATTTNELLRKQLILRRRDYSALKGREMDLATFFVTTSIAIVTAFGAHYASSLPNVISFADYATSFMFGFGLDQLRDTVNTPSNTTTAAAGARQLASPGTTGATPAANA